MEPSYITLYGSGRLEKIKSLLEKIITRCTLCPQQCGTDRTVSRSGRCRSGILPVVSSFHPHFGEERCLVGQRGSGTIFFTHCNLSCIFCQNYDISHLGRGCEISYEELSRQMLMLQAKGCHNINFVSPTHMIYPIIKALLIAIPGGLSVPLVYNSGGYDSDEILRLLEGVFDIYMPDFKYMDIEAGEHLSGAKDYPKAVIMALMEMHRQVGDLEIDRNGVAVKGLLIRHLVLPNNLAATDRVIAFIADLSKNTYINIMDQYRPEYRARECNDLKRRITMDEYRSAVQLASGLGLKRIDGV